MLLSLVDDPVATTEVLTVKDRRRLRARAEMADPEERAGASRNPDAADRGRAAYRLLVG